MSVSKYTVEDRFWAKVDKNGSVPGLRPELGQCWIWTAYIGTKGYGQFNKSEKAHHVSYRLSGGIVPLGMQLDHLCRNRACVRPSHLEPVTPRDNTLRGDTIPAKNTKKTHCSNGHEFNEENTGHYLGKRQCRTCIRLAVRRLRAAAVTEKRSVLL